MTGAMSVCLAMLAAAAGGVPAPSPTASAGPAASAPTATISVPLETIVSPLVENLAAERFQVREDATEALRHIGMPALEMLQKAAESKDPEVHVRATRILEDLQLGITPDWPAEIAVLARRCDDMNDYEREQAISRIAQAVGPKATLFLVQRLLADDQRGSQRAMYALQGMNNDDAARLVLEALPDPQGPNQTRAVTWAVGRVGLAAGAIRFVPKPAPKPAEAKEDAAEAGVRNLLGLLAQRKFEEVRQAAADLAKAAPRDARPVYLEAEAMAGLGKDAEAKAARVRAAAMNADDKASHAAAAAVLERVGRRILAAAEWETVLKTAPVGGAADLNAQVHLCNLYAASGLFEQAVKYLQAALDQYEKSKDSVTLEGAGAEVLRQEILRLSRRSQQWPAVSGAGLEDDTAGAGSSVEVFVAAKDGKLEAWRKAMADSSATISMEIQPRDLRIFVDVPITLRYEPKDRQVVALLGTVRCAKPVPVNLGAEKTDVRLGVDTPSHWLAFTVDTVTGEMTESARFEKVYVARIKAPLVLAGLVDAVWTVQGRRYTGEDIPKGAALDALPSQLQVTVEGTTADKRRLTWTLTLPTAKAQMAPSGFEVPALPKTGGGTVTMPGGGIINLRGGRVIIGGPNGQPIQIFGD